MAIDPETRKPRIANVTAGLSGPAIKPIALRMVYDASRAVKIPVIGMGGISTAADIVEFMLAGATAVQIGTASYWDPVATEKIAAELETWCSERHIATGRRPDRRNGDGVAVVSLQLSLSNISSGLADDRRLKTDLSRPHRQNRSHREIAHQLIPGIDQIELG